MAIVVAFLCFSFIREIPSEPSKALRYVNYSIFGKDYARTPIFDTELKGHVYYIVSGHGGPDPGAMHKKDGKWLCEDEYAYDVSLRLARNLIGHGAKVYMITRDENDGIRDEQFLLPDKDETVWGGAHMPLNQKARLKQRSEAINKLYFENRNKGYTHQKTIITHVDSRYHQKKIDVFFYHNPQSSSGHALANTLYRTVKNQYEKHQNDRGYEGVVESRNLWMLRETIPTAVYIELGNISNPFDQKRLLIPNNRQAIANWLAQGVLQGDK